MQFIIYLLVIFTVILDEGTSIASISPGAPYSLRENKSVVIRIPKNATITNGTVKLGNVADISCLPTTWCKDLEQLQITQIIPPKKNQKIPGSYIKSRVMEVTSNGYQVLFEIPDEIELQLNPIISPQKSIQDKIIKHVENQLKLPSDAKVKIKEIYGETNYLNSENNIEPRFVGNLQESSLQRILEFTLFEKTKSGSVFRGELKVKLEVLAKRWVSKQNIAYRKKINKSDFEFKEIDLITAKGLNSVAIDDFELEKITSTAEYINKSIAQGHVLLPEYIVRAPDIERGVRIDVVILSSNGFRISTKGTVLKSAAIGDKLPVKLDKTGKIVSGELKDKATVEIQL